MYNMFQFLEFFSLEDKEEWNTELVLKEGVEIISRTTTPVKAMKLTNKFIELFNTHKNENDTLSGTSMGLVATEMKRFADNNFNKAWQVTVMYGCYASSVSCEPFRTLHFSYKDALCMVWQSDKRN